MIDLNLEPIWTALDFPTSVAIGTDGTLFVAESGLPFDGAPKGGRILARSATGEIKVLAKGLAPPVNGILPLDGRLIVSVGGHPAHLSSIAMDGSVRMLMDGFAGPGNYHLNMAVLGPDGLLYFGIGAMTNSGVVGADGCDLAWLRELRHDHDIPGFTIRLTGRNFPAPDPASGETVETGPFCRFGEPAGPRQVVTAQKTATASVMRCRPDGSGSELFAWGIRNAYGLGFLRDGRLIAIDQGADERGVRPIANVPDFLFHVKQDCWYGWPDFMADRPITDPMFRPADGPAPEFIIGNHADLPPPEAALVEFPAHAAATRFVELPDKSGRFAGHLLVTLFGDERPMTAPHGPRVGRNLVRIDPRDWSVHDVPLGGMQRPIDVVFDTASESILVLDFGEFEMGPAGAVSAVRGSGRLGGVGLPALVAAMSKCLTTRTTLN